MGNDGGSLGCAGLWKRINSIVAEISWLTAQMAGDGTRRKDVGASTRQRRLNVSRRAAPEEITKVNGVTAPMHRSHRRNQVKAEKLKKKKKKSNFCYVLVRRHLGSTFLSLVHSRHHPSTFCSVLHRRHGP
jgi:hypothetical protein